MRKLINFFVVLVLVSGLGGCFGRTQPIYNVTSEPVSTASAQSVTAEQVGQVIKTCLINYAWNIESVAPGSYKATTSWREHSATVEITYDNKSYNIALVSSVNLLQKEGKIHRNYNKRVRQLEQAINTELNKL
jgi:hypothetical protein